MTPNCTLKSSTPVWFSYVHLNGNLMANIVRCTSSWFRNDTVGWLLLHPVRCKLQWSGEPGPRLACLPKMHKHQNIPRNHVISPVLGWYLNYRSSSSQLDEYDWEFCWLACHSVGHEAGFYPCAEFWCYGWFHRDVVQEAVTHGWGQVNNLVTTIRRSYQKIIVLRQQGCRAEEKVALQFFIKV